jgi:hypothetical protein
VRRITALTGAYAIAAAWFAAHLFYLSPALEDIDSINFALGLHHFDPTLHQPHPPGYPVFIALGRVALAVIHLVASGLSDVRADALALSIWSAIGGMVAIVAAGHLFDEVTWNRRPVDDRPSWAAMMLAATPLFWVTGLRPMSDMVGLGVALVAQALLVRASRVRDGDRGARLERRALVIGAMVAGLAAGIRVQTALLTLPLFVYALVRQRRAGRWLVRPVAAVVAATLVWAVPLVTMSDGPGAYLRALGTQGAEDFAWVDMLWAHPAPRAMAFALYDSFVLPFGSPMAGAVVLVVAAAGAIVVVITDRRSAVLLALAFAPYAIFHLLFQEAANLRYSTPLVVPIAFLMIAALAALPLPRFALARRPGQVSSPVVIFPVIFFVIRTFPVGAAYGGEPHPAFRAIGEMTAMVERAAATPAAVFSHYALRRSLQAAPTKLPVVEAQPGVEWLALEDYWLKGGTGEVWFLADPRRTDLALIDPRVRRSPMQYRWSVADAPALMGTRPMGADWYRLAPPGWFATEGWELTPETAGRARASGKRLQQQPITAYVRRRADPVRAIIAGRDLGGAADRPSLFEVAVDGTVVDRWRVDPATDGTDFFHVMALPQGVPPGTGNYAALTISARAEQAGARTPEVAVQQFDLQDLQTVMFGFGRGWYQTEYDKAKGLSWRWTSNAATLRILPARQVVLHLTAESPMQYFDQPPTVTIRAGSRELSRVDAFPRDQNVTWHVVIPEDALRASDGTVTIETSKIYLPGKAEGTADARKLGLRIFEVRVE